MVQTHKWGISKYAAELHPADPTGRHAVAYLCHGGSVSASKGEACRDKLMAALEYRFLRMTYYGRSKLTALA